MKTNTHKPTGQLTIATIVVALSALAIAPVLRATTITVTNTACCGPGTLGSALFSANNGDTINFALPIPAKSR
jgi:hypothetical protein